MQLGSPAVPDLTQGNAPRRAAGARQVTLKHVAERAGVSVKTVSNVVNGYAHVTDSTRARVQKALDELSYRPNLAARHLRKGRSNVIALGLPELDQPYFAELATSVVRYGEEAGWSVLIDQTDGVEQRELRLLDGIPGHLVDGLILSPRALPARELRRRRDATPLVLLEARACDGPADHVSIDVEEAARVATTHLLQTRRRRVAAIGDQRTAAAQGTRLRRKGYGKALRSAGLPVRRELVVPVTGYHRRDGAAAMRALLELPEPPDAVFCFSDLLALGALRVLAERGVRVPEEIAVVGWDDIEDGRYSTPTLSTISPDKQQIAATAVELLAARLRRDHDAPPQEVTAGFSLAVRESTAGRTHSAQRHPPTPTPPEAHTPEQTRGPIRGARERT